jgi:hypothetical protein
MKGLLTSTMPGYTPSRTKGRELIVLVSSSVSSGAKVSELLTGSVEVSELTELLRRTAGLDVRNGDVGLKTSM